MNLLDIDKYIQSLKKHGFSDDMIADFLQHMEVTVKDNIILNPKSTLSGMEQWAIACGADIAFANGQYLNDLTTGIAKHDWVKLLSDIWEIDNKDHAIETINWLFMEGHRMQFDVYWQAVNIVSDEELKEFIWEHIAKDENEEFVARHRLHCLSHGLGVFKHFNLFDSDVIPNMLIWDYAKIINLTRGCYDAEYFTRDEALAYIMKCVEPIRETYNSWRQLSISYQFARYFWRGIDEEIFKRLLAGMHLLLTQSNSPWVKLKWDDSKT
jgi:hypothetical protein